MAGGALRSSRRSAAPSGARNRRGRSDTSTAAMIAVSSKAIRGRPKTWLVPPMTTTRALLRASIARHLPTTAADRNGAFIAARSLSSGSFRRNILRHPWPSAWTATARFRDLPPLSGATWRPLDRRDPARSVQPNPPSRIKQDASKQRATPEGCKRQAAAGLIVPATARALGARRKLSGICTHRTIRPAAAADQSRIKVLLPNRLSTRSTASTAVRLWSSNAGLSSMMSSEPMPPRSAIISMHNCASR